MTVYTRQAQMLVAANSQQAIPVQVAVEIAGCRVTVTQTNHWAAGRIIYSAEFDTPQHAQAFAETYFLAEPESADAPASGLLKFYAAHGSVVGSWPHFDRNGRRLPEAPKLVHGAAA